MEKINIDKLPENYNNKKIIKKIINDWFLSIQFKYQSNYKNTKILRRFIEEICNHFCFGEKTKARIVLISDELNNNAIEYWSDADWINYLRIDIKTISWEIFLNLEVEDNWKGKSHKTALEMETMRAHKLKRWYFNHDSIRWRWLFLITVKIVDRLYFKNSKRWWLIVGIKTKINCDN